MKKLTIILSLIFAFVLSFVAGCSDLSDDTEPPHTHSFGNWYTNMNATCNAPGEQLRICSSCGTEESRPIAQLTGSQCETGHTHSYGNWTTTKNATCDESGEESRNCSCGDTETRSIAKLTGSQCESSHTHSFGAWTTTKNATCNETGEQTRSCSCGDIQTQSIPKLTGSQCEETNLFIDQNLLGAWWCNSAGTTEYGIAFFEDGTIQSYGGYWNGIQNKWINLELKNGSYEAKSGKIHLYGDFYSWLSNGENYSVSGSTLNFSDKTFSNSAVIGSWINYDSSTKILFKSDGTAGFILVVDWGEILIEEITYTVFSNYIAFSNGIDFLYNNGEKTFYIDIKPSSYYGTYTKQ